MRNIILGIGFIALLFYVFAPNSFADFQNQIKKSLSFVQTDAPLNIPSNTSPSNDTLNIILHDAKYLYTVDGDTIAVIFDGKEERVRFLMMNTPETKNVSTPEPFGVEASNFTTNFFKKAKTIQLEFDTQKRDPYGRLLAYVYFDGIMINKELIQNGLAEVTIYHPNNKYEVEFYQLQNYAINNKLGMWSQN